MTHRPDRQSKPRRIVAFAAAVALLTALSGCVVYPAGPVYGGYYGYYGHHDHYWR